MSDAVRRVAEILAERNWMDLRTRDGNRLVSWEDLHEDQKESFIEHEIRVGTAERIVKALDES